MKIAPLAVGTLRQYREGWNCAASGALISDCPYHEGSNDWTLWVNGLNDYQYTPFNCQARRRYNSYYHQGRNFTDTELVFGEVVVEDDFTMTTIRYEDGSAIVITPTLLHVEAKNGVPIATCELRKEEVA